MTKEKFSRLLFLLDDTFEKEENLTSTVKLLLFGAREFSGRDINTGEYDGKDYKDFDSKHNVYISRRFIGLFLYLILLEVIGSTFNSKDKPNSKNGIGKTLDLLSNETDYSNEIAGLRNSLAHRFSLCTQNNGIGKSFCYELSWDKVDFIVKKPENEWNGDFSTKIDNSHTKIGVENLIEYIEEIYTKLVEELKKADSLESTPVIAELKARYTVKNQ